MKIKIFALSMLTGLFLVSTWNDLFVQNKRKILQSNSGIV